MQPYPGAQDRLSHNSQAGALRWPLALLILVLVSAIAYVAMQDSAPPTSAAPIATSSDPHAGHSHAAPSKPKPSEERADSAPSKPLPTSGGLRGRLSLPTGVAPPENWELVLNASKFFESGNAKPRRVSFTDSVLDFVVTDLEFGTYDVRPRAAGMNSNWVPIAISPEASEPYISITMTPAGTLSGRIEYENGLPSEGVIVTLERVEVLDEEDKLSYSSKTDLSGNYEFPLLPDGDYELRYGDEYNPILKPKRISFAAPSMHLRPQVLEKIGALNILVLDDGGNPLPDVSITGFGNHGGTIDHFTDSLGECTVAGLPAGNFKISTDHPGFSSQSKLIELLAGETTNVQLTLSL